MKRFRFIAYLLVLCLCLTSCSLVSIEVPGQKPGQAGESTASQAALQIHIIDVGQGDSTFIELPDGKTMLIDAGEREYGEVVVDYIKKFGYSRIDYLIGTHPHSDHIGGLKQVVEALEIGKVYMPRKSSTTATFKNLLTAIQDKGLKVETARAGKTIAVSKDFSVDILSPVSEDYGDNMNLYSVVVKITYQQMRFLFMGDAETENEEELGNVTAEFIRVGHHGSNTSSGQAFVDRVKAKIAVISVGRDNSYGLPKDKIMERWEASGATVYRTDEMGSLVFLCDGKRILQGEAEFTESIEVKESPTHKWVLNISSKKIHEPDCSAVSSMKEENKKESDQTIAALLQEGYTPCGTCDPVEG